MSSPAAPVVLAATSGTGKTTLARRLVEGPGSYGFSISATTRPARPGERDGVDYHFLARPVFEERIAAGEFVEWATVHDHLYGTLRSELETQGARGRHVVLDIDVQGARQIRETVPEATLIFVLPPSVDIMMARLTRRGTESREVVARRLRTAVDELAAVHEFDHVVVNDELDECVTTIRGIVEEGSEAPESIVDLEALRHGIGRLLAEEYRASTNEAG